MDDDAAWFNEEEDDGGRSNNDGSFKPPFSSNNQQQKSAGGRGGGGGGGDKGGGGGGPRKKLNGYGLFAVQRKNELEKEKGQKVTLTFDQVLKMFDKDWTELTEEQRNWWKAKAKGSKVDVYPSKNKKKGQKLVDQPLNRNYPPPPPPKEREVEVRTPLPYFEESTTDDNSFSAVGDFLKASKEPITKRTFVMISANLYSNDIPGELGLTFFSLEEGISVSDSVLIPPGEHASHAMMKKQMEDLKLPPPWFHEAKSQYPVLQSLARDNYGELLQKIKGAMDGDNVKLGGTGTESQRFDYVLFATRNEVKKIQNAFTWLKEHATDVDVEGFNPRIFPLQELIWRIASVNKHEYGNDWCNPMYTDMATKYGEDVYKEVKMMACGWHTQEEFVRDAHVCALHRVKSYTFMALRILCPYFDIRLYPQSHFPEQLTRPEPRYRLIYPGLPIFTADKQCASLTADQKAKIDKLIEESENERAQLTKEYKQAGNIQSKDLKKMVEEQIKASLDEKLRQLKETEKSNYDAIEIRAETEEQAWEIYESQCASSHTQSNSVCGESRDSEFDTNSTVSRFYRNKGLGF